MSRPSDPIKKVRKIVLFIDICSSTTILEDLLDTEHEGRWRGLLIRLKEFLQREQKKNSFEIYKFLGDGWVLLFDPVTTQGADIMNFLERLCRVYISLFRSKISNVIGNANHQVGITLGIDTGTLIRMVMNNEVEYVGRALNVAARLQSAIKENDSKPANKLLITKNSFTDLNLRRTRFRRLKVTRRLANIAGGECFEAWKIIFGRRR